MVGTQPALARWSYTTLMHAVHQRAIASGVLFSDASLRVADSHGDVHQVQLVPAQVAGVADEFATYGIDFDVAPVSGVAAIAGALLQMLPLLLVLYVAAGAMRQLGAGGRAQALALPPADVDTR